MRARAVLPQACRTGWFEVPGETPAQAASNFPKATGVWGLFWTPDPGLPGRRLSFVQVEVEGAPGFFLVRTRHAGLVRRGAPRAPTTLQQVARALGWEGDPQDLAAPDWVGDEGDFP